MPSPEIQLERHMLIRRVDITRLKMMSWKPETCLMTRYDFSTDASVTIRLRFVPHSVGCITTGACRYRSNVCCPLARSRSMNSTDVWHFTIAPASLSSRVHLDPSRCSASPTNLLTLRDFTRSGHSLKCLKLRLWYMLFVRLSSVGGP